MSGDPSSNGAAPAAADAAPPGPRRPTRRRRARALPGGGETRRHTLVAIVLDKPGVLNRVSRLMRARNFNIDSLAVSHTDQPDISRMTITPPRRRRRGRAGGEAALPADRRPEGPGRHDRADRRSTSSRWSRSGRPTATGRRSSSSSSCPRAGSSTWRRESVIVEVTGTEAEVDAFVALVRGFGIKELVRTGAVVMARGSESIEEAIKR